MNEDKPLNAMDQWMVQRNLEYVKTEGLETVLNRLRAQGYNRVANAVETSKQMNDTWDDGFTQGYRDASDSKDKQESLYPWDHPYSQGYSYGYDCGNYRRVYGHDPIQTIVD